MADKKQASTKGKKSNSKSITPSKKEANKLTKKEDKTKNSVIKNSASAINLKLIKEESPASLVDIPIELNNEYKYFKLKYLDGTVLKYELPETVNWI